MACNIHHLCFFAVFGLLGSTLHANEPWFAGPFFTPAGKTYPKNHTQLRATNACIDNKISIDRGPLVVETATRLTNQTIVSVRHGITDFLDVRLSLPYVFNKELSQQGQGTGDFHLMLGYQAIKPRVNSPWPYLRVTLQETIPTGRYEQLLPQGLKTDSTGRGSYRRALNLNFESIAHPFIDHFLRTRLSLGYVVGTSVNVRGLNHYGGGIDTNGRVYPGYRRNASVSFEYSLTQQWVPVMEILYYDSSATHFIGQAGKTPKGKIAEMTRAQQSELSYLPGIEYNISQTYGIVAGYWFALRHGKTDGLKAYTVALNAKW